MTREQRRYWRREKIKAVVTVVLIILCVIMIEVIAK
mgnify:FL=1